MKEKKEYGQRLVLYARLLTEETGEEEDPQDRVSHEQILAKELGVDTILAQLEALCQMAHRLMMPGVAKERIGYLRLIERIVGKGFSPSVTVRDASMIWLDYLRSVAKSDKPPISKREVLDELVEGLVDSSDLREHIAQAWDGWALDAIEEIINRLPPHKQKLIRARFGVGHDEEYREAKSIKEIAEREFLKPEAVEERIKSAISMLRKAFAASDLRVLLMPTRAVLRLELARREQVRRAVEILKENV